MRPDSRRAPDTGSAVASIDSERQPAALAPAARALLEIAPWHLALFLLVMALWGLNFAVSKAALEQLPPLANMTARLILVSLLLLPFVKRPRERWGEIAALSVTLGLLNFGLLFWGLKTVDAATASVAVQLQVPFAALISAIFLNDPLGWRRALGMAIAFAGVVVIAGSPRLQGQDLALLAVIGASFVWAISNFQVKRLAHLGGLTLTAWVSVLATPQLALASLLLEQGQWAAFAGADWRAWGSVVYQGVVSAIFGYGCWYWLLARYSVNQAMPFTLLVPLFGVISGHLLLGEPVTLALVLGGALTVAGVGIIQLRRPRLAAPETTRV